MDVGFCHWSTLEGPTLEGVKQFRGLDPTLVQDGCLEWREEGDFEREVRERFAVYHCIISSYPSCSKVTGS
jgi:hypothetical protein